jgi:hypothetical protein
MSVFAGPIINTSGLVLELDAANLKSYDRNQNLTLYSQDWTQQFQSIANVTIATANTVAPDGTLTGQRITTTVSGIVNDGFIQKLYSYSGKSIPTANNLFTFSSYVKQGTSPKTTVLLGPYNGTSYKDFYVILNWSDLSITTGGTIAGRNYYGVTPDANGWYRLWCTTDNYYGATDFGYRIFTRDNGLNNVAGEYSYIWGSQVEYSNGPGPYIVTTSSPILPSNTWIDLSTTKNNATLYNLPLYNANSSFNFNGTTQNCSLPLSSLPTGNTISISFWTNNLTTAYTDSIIWAGDSGNSRILNVHLPWTNGVVYFDCGGIGGYDRIQTPSGLTTPQLTGWHNWVFTKNATTGYMAMYLDGVLLVSGTGNYRPLITPTYFFLASSTGAQYWSGTLGNFSMYNIELTPDQIIQNFNAYRGRYGL